MRKGSIAYNKTALQHMHRPLVYRYIPVICAVAYKKVYIYRAYIGLVYSITQRLYTCVGVFGNSWKSLDPIF